jgi:hypothetical protein
MRLTWVLAAAISAAVVLLPAVLRDTSDAMGSDCFSLSVVLLLWPALVGLVAGFAVGAWFARRGESAGAYAALLGALAMAGGVGYLVGATGDGCYSLDNSVDDAAVAGLITVVATLFGLAPGYVVGRLLRR